MKKIKLTQGKYALVDNKDFEYLNQWKWFAYNSRGKFYARRNSFNQQTKKQYVIHMHKVIMVKIPKGKEIDHINGNGLNNQRNNLRFATRFQNMMNRKLNSNNKSGYKGVFWHKRDKVWSASGRIKNKTIYLGYFKNILDAKKSYDKFAKENFKEFVRQLT